MLHHLTTPLPMVENTLSWIMCLTSPQRVYDLKKYDKEPKTIFQHPRFQSNQAFMGQFRTMDGTEAACPSPQDPIDSLVVLLPITHQKVTCPCLDRFPLHERNQFNIKQEEQMLWLKASFTRQSFWGKCNTFLLRFGYPSTRQWCWRSKNGAIQKSIPECKSLKQNIRYVKRGAHTQSCSQLQ